MPGENCNCLVLYDWKGAVEALAWLDLAVKFFETVGAGPDMGVANGAEPRPFQKLLDDLRLEGPGEVTSLELYATIPNYKQLLFGWRVHAALLTTDSRTMLFCYDNELFPFDVSFLTNLVEQLSSCCELVYGIGYQRSFEKGPAEFALGMSVGLGYSEAEMEEADYIGAWLNERIEENRHTKGMMRDVFPINVLSDVHLKKVLDNGQTLKAWIESSRERGELKSCGDSTWIWTVPEKHITETSDALAKMGVLICR